MKWKLKNKLYFALFLLTFMIISAFAGKYVQASLSSSLNATVKISICGNEITESGEECDNGDINNKQCTSLGFSGGDLACDISCSFDVSSCIVPTINSSNVAPNEVSSLLATGNFSKPPSDNITSVSSLTATKQIIINIPASDGTSQIILPQNVVITKSNNANFDPTTLTTSNVITSSLSGFSSSLTVDGAMQFGISSATLEFSTPVTFSIYVGTSLNGQTLNIVRSTSTSSGWTSDGIVSPATCIVAAGLCSFQATKASYFATNRTVAFTPTPTPTPTPTSSTSTSGSSSTTTSSSNTSTSTTQTTTSSTQTTTPTVAAKSILPQILQMFYVDESGKIRITNIFSTVKIWVDAWRGSASEKCDINDDGECNVKDLSVLLFYVER